MNAAKLILVQVLRRPQGALDMDGAAWSELIGQASAAGLLARVSLCLRRAGLWSRLPEGPRRHLRSAEILAARQQAQAQFEIAAIGQALVDLDGPVVLLKGAAYVALSHAAAAGRLLSDIDLMVPRALIGRAESALMMAGWVSAESDSYNQRYYREWMHEIPPMRHIRRGTVIDLHHTIVPPTARPNLDADLLFRDAIPVAGFPRLSVLSAQDRIVHAAAHLFLDGDLSRGLRDLSDISVSLQADVMDDPDRLRQLRRRAEALCVAPELDLAVHYVREIFGLGTEGKAPAGVGRFLFDRALMPEYPTCEDRWTPMARLFVFVRSHWLRMPLRLLVPHLLRKLRMRAQAAATQPAP